MIITLWRDSRKNKTSAIGSMFGFKSDTVHQLLL